MMLFNDTNITTSEQKNYFNDEDIIEGKKGEF